MRLLPDCVWIQLCDRLSTLDVLIDDRRHVGFRHFGVPGGVRIDDDGRSLLAGAEARRTADEHFTGSHTLLHEADVKGHEEGGCSGATAGRLRVPRGPRIGADDDVMFRLWHACSFVGFELSRSVICRRLRWRNSRIPGM